MTIAQASDTLPVREVAAGMLLDRSDERAVWLAREAAAGQAGYDRGYEAGYREGRAAADAEWAAALQPAREAARQAADTGPHSEMELRRWSVRGEPRTRAEFARPHPDDYKGGPVAPW